MRFRERQTNYVKELESSMTDLQHSVTSIMLEKDLLDRQNAEMTMLLRQKIAGDDMFRRWERTATLERSFGTTLRHEDAVVMRKHSSNRSTGRVAVSPVPYSTTHQDRSSDPDPSVFGKSPNHISMTAIDGWSAIDFILALETPCRDHVTLPSHISDSPAYSASDQHGPSNHAMTMTAAVYARTLSLTDHTLHLDEGHNTIYGFVPQFEVERLLDFSRELPIEDQYMTPVQIYVALRDQAESSLHLRDMLDSLRGPMAAEAECCGFGAVLPVHKFQEMLPHKR